MLIHSILTSDWQTGHVLGCSKLPSSLHLTVKLDCVLLCRKKLPRSHSYVTSAPNSTRGEEGDTILWWMENQISGKEPLETKRNIFIIKTMTICR